MKKVGKLRHPLWFLAIILAAGAVAAGCSGARPPGANQRSAKNEMLEKTNSTGISKAIADLRNMHGQIYFGISAEKFRESMGRMHALLAEWNPIGTSSNELVHLLGPPTERSARRNPNPNRLGYRIDTGLAGAVWFFDLENQKVVRMEVKAID